jgi:hypothetical protein
MDNNPGPSKLAHPGGARTKGQKQPDSVKYGNSRAYIEARLSRDAEEGCREAGALLQGIRDGRISHYAASTTMGYSQRKELTGRVEYPNVTKRVDWAVHRVLHPRPDKGKAPPEEQRGGGT